MKIWSSFSVFIIFNTNVSLLYCIYSACLKDADIDYMRTLQKPNNHTCTHLITCTQVDRNITDKKTQNRAELQKQAEMKERGGGRSRQAESKNTVRRKGVLTDRNDYSQNGYRDVVTDEVVITCSCDESAGRHTHTQKKTQSKQKVSLYATSTLIQTREIC